MCACSLVLIPILRNLDPEKEFRRIRDAGGFQCVKPGGEVQDGW